MKYGIGILSEREPALPVKRVVLWVCLICGGLFALHNMGNAVTVERIWNHDFGHMTKTGEVVGQYHRIIAVFVAKGCLGAVAFWYGIWGLLKNCPRSPSTADNQKEAQPPAAV